MQKNQIKKYKRIKVKMLIDKEKKNLEKLKRRQKNEIERI